MSEYMTVADIPEPVTTDRTRGEVIQSAIDALRQLGYGDLAEQVIERAQREHDA